jgi:predicted helicase
LRKWFYELKENDRNQVYLANTLEPFESHGLLAFMREISEESKTANELKLRKKILVITANPPYRGMSANRGQWIQDLLKKGYPLKNGARDNGYYQIDGKPLGERNPKWLQDDYVKFIRFAQWKIDTAGEGVVGFITNHSYLDNPTFRGMRQSLLNSFDRIYLLNLHGSSLKKEKSPDGSKDENVFDIRPGVAIALFVKNKESKDKKVYYSELFGKREEKYHWLDRHDITNVEWKTLKPESPNYLLVPEDSSLRNRYYSYCRITDIFPANNIGIVTSRDDLTIKWTPEEVWQTVSEFVAMDAESARTTYNLGKDVLEWKVSLAQDDIRKTGLRRELITSILYRPFDKRYTYYTGHSRGFMCRPRLEIMGHMMKENLALLTMRQVSLDEDYTHFFVSESMVDNRAMLSSKGIVQIHPLYLYDGSERTANVPALIFEKLKTRYQKDVTPEEIFYYVYAVFHSNIYRTRYSQFLRSDFPRVPFTEDYQTFKSLSEIGQNLVSLHLLKKKLGSSIRFDIQGSNIVECVNWDNGRLLINKEQFFDGVPEKAWRFYVGGYQVLYKWLKSRKKKEMTSGEIEQFIQMVEAVNQTLEHMKRIDEIPFLDGTIIPLSTS